MEWLWNGRVRGRSDALKTRDGMGKDGRESKRERLRMMRIVYGVRG